MDSVESQNCGRWEQVVLYDLSNVGVDAANRLFASMPFTGDYVLALDDDDVLYEGNTICALTETLRRVQPDVLVARVQHWDRVRPDDSHWEARKAELNEIGGSSVVVRADVWRRYVTEWGAHYGGDFDFIQAALQERSVYWLDRIIVRQFQQGLGRPEYALSLGSDADSGSA